MNVRELREALAGLPDDVVVLTRRPEDEYDSGLFTDVRIGSAVETFHRHNAGDGGSDYTRHVGGGETIYIGEEVLAVQIGGYYVT